MPLGLTSLVLNRTFRNFVSMLATSMVSFVESVQYIFRDTQSIVRPSGVPTSESVA